MGIEVSRSKAVPPCRSRGIGGLALLIRFGRVFSASMGVARGAARHGGGITARADGHGPGKPRFIRLTGFQVLAVRWQQLGRIDGRIGRMVRMVRTVRTGGRARRAGVFLPK